MLAYYFFKYWKQGTVGLMVSIVVAYFGIFSYSIIAAQNADRKLAMEAENQQLASQLSITPPTNQLQQKDIEHTNSLYKKSINVFEQIHNLKEKNQDTSQLETLFAESVKSLSHQKQEAAVVQLDKIETQIAKMNDTMKLTPSPLPSDIPVLSVTPSTTVTPSVGPEVLVATTSAESNQ